MPASGQYVVYRIAYLLHESTIADTHCIDVSGVSFYRLYGDNYTYKGVSSGGEGITHSVQYIQSSCPPPPFPLG